MSRVPPYLAYLADRVDPSRCKPRVAGVQVGLVEQIRHLPWADRPDIEPEHVALGWFLACRPPARDGLLRGMAFVVSLTDIDRAHDCAAMAVLSAQGHAGLGDFLDPACAIPAQAAAAWAFIAAGLARAAVTMALAPWQIEWFEHAASFFTQEHEAMTGRWNCSSGGAPAAVPKT